jgi:hypothetical protein
MIDGHGHFASIWDSPNTEGSNSVSLDLYQVTGAYTNKDTIDELLNETTYTADLAIGEAIIGDPGIILDDNGIIGGSFTVTVGVQFPPANLSLGISNPPPNIIDSGNFDDLEQKFIYGMINTFISPEDAFDYDYYYDGKIDYGYNYDYYFYQDYYDYFYNGY